MCNLHNKTNYVVHIRTLKQTLTHGLILKKVHRKFNQKAWVKAYIGIKTKLRTEAKTDFEKDFFKLLNNSVFAKTIDNVRNHRDIRTKIKTANSNRR